MNAEIDAMKKWCVEHYEQGADTMVECWADEEYAKLFISHDGKPLTKRQAWHTLKGIAGWYKDRQADAINSAF